MHILIFPSWYPTKNNKLSGIFFKEQAEALVKQNIDVGCIAINESSPRYMFSKKEITFHFDDKNINGINTISVLYPIPNRFKSLRSIVRKIVFSRYIGKDGKPDFVHLHSFLYGDLAIWIKEKYGINYVATEHSTGFAGKLYKDRNPINFLDVINQQDNFIFHHVGEESEYLTDINVEKIIKHGLKSYIETLNIIGQMEIAVIFTSGYTFESTTKIFDYIALDRIILIITDGKIKTGAIHDITKNYPQVYWTKNNAIDIEITLESIKNDIQNIKYEDKYLYSREYGLSKLNEFLENQQ